MDLSRCVLASCSPWFDTKLKVHKTMKEIIEVESCKNYEVFHLVLTYMYTGKISLDKHNVDDILDISHNFAISKLKNYAVDYLEKMLRANNCLKIIELSTKYHLSDLTKTTMTFINKNFKYIIQYHEIEKMSIEVFQEFLAKAWYFPDELILRFITHWVSQEKSGREENFVTLLHNVTWASLDPTFISAHLNKEELFYSSPESLLTVLRLLDSNNIVLNDKFTQVYHDLQDKQVERERLYPDHELEQELDDNNSFLSIAINDLTNKDLEHQGVDETFSSFILQPEPYSSYRHPSGQDQTVNEAAPDMMALEKPYIAPTNLVKASILERQKQSEGGQFRGVGAPRYHTPPADQPFQDFPPGSQEYRPVVPGHDYRGETGSEYRTGASQEYRAEQGQEYRPEQGQEYRGEAASDDFQGNPPSQQPYRPTEQEYRETVTSEAQYRSALTLDAGYRNSGNSEPEYRNVVASEYRNTEFRTVGTSIENPEYRDPSTKEKAASEQVSNVSCSLETTDHIVVTKEEQVYSDSQSCKEQEISGGGTEQLLQQGCSSLTTKEKTENRIISPEENVAPESDYRDESPSKSTTKLEQIGAITDSQEEDVAAKGSDYHEGGRGPDQDYRVSTPTSEADLKACQAQTNEYRQPKSEILPPVSEQQHNYRAAGPQPEANYHGLTGAVEEQYRPPSCGQPLLTPDPPSIGKPDCRLPGMPGQYRASPGPQYATGHLEEYPTVVDQYRPPASCPDYMASSPSTSQGKMVIPDIRPKDLQSSEQNSARNSPLSGVVSHVASPVPTGGYREGQCGGMGVPDYYRAEAHYQVDRPAQAYRPAQELYREEGRTIYDGTLYRSCYPGMEQYRGCGGQYSEAYRVEERPEYSQNRDIGEARSHRMDRLPSRTDFDFSTEYSILEQVINEHTLSEAEASGKYTDRMSTTKRYDPKHRALAEAFRHQMEEAEMADQSLGGGGGGPNYTMEAQCGVARPTEQSGVCRNAGSREGGTDCQYTRVGEGRRALATPVPDPEFIERTVEEPRVVSQPVPPEPPPSSPPPSLVHLASCAQEPLHTPEKSEAPASPPLLTPRTRLSSTKTEAQQLFLTPKEKYAKGVSALSDTAKQTVPCELNQDLVLDIPKENESPDKEALTEDSLQPVKRVKLTMADLMRAKKRMAEQKKLILEHGEVRPAQKPRIKTRPVKKKVTRKLQANDVFHRTEGPGVATDVEQGKAEMEAANPIELPAAPMKKRIVNRKDKLLAEHRSQSLHMEETEGEPNQAAPLKRIFTCPICSAESSSCKDHYQHIKVCPHTKLQGLDLTTFGFPCEKYYSFLMNIKEVTNLSK